MSRRTLLSRLEQLEAGSKTREPVLIRYGWLRSIQYADYNPSHFPNFNADEPSQRIERDRGAAGISRTGSSVGGSPSERDWAYAMRALARGDEPDVVTRAIAAHRFDKPNLQYYAEHTVEKALAALNRPGQIEYASDAGVER